MVSVVGDFSIQIRKVFDRKNKSVFEYFDFSDLKEGNRFSLDLSSGLSLDELSWKAFIVQFPWHKVYCCRLSELIPRKRQDKIVARVISFLDHPLSLPPRYYPWFSGECKMTTADFDVDLIACPVELLRNRKNIIQCHAHVRCLTTQENILKRMSILPDLNTAVFILRHMKPRTGTRMSHPTLTSLRIIVNTVDILEAFESWSEFPALERLVIVTYPFSRDNNSLDRARIHTVLLRWIVKCPRLKAIRCDYPDICVRDVFVWYRERQGIQHLICPSSSRQKDSLVYMLPSDVIRRILVPMLHKK